MTSFILYIIQSSLVFICLFGLYKALFSKVTFHHLNRAILVALPLMALLAPLTYLVVPTAPQPIVQVTATFNELVVEGGQAISQTFQASAANSFPVSKVLIAAYLIGVIVLLIRMSQSVWGVLKLKKQANTKTQDGYQLVYSNLPQAFSFFNWVFIPKDNNRLMLEHEIAHIRLRHSVDVFLAELYIMLFWFNPLVYVYRKALKSIHEYQADAWVLKGNVKTSGYLQALLQNIEAQTTNNLYSYFNQSLIKKRITMMTKKPTSKLYKLTYFVFLAGVVLISTAFTKPRFVSHLLDHSIAPVANAVSVVHSTPPSLFPVKNRSKQDITSYYGTKHRHPVTKKLIHHHGIDIRATEGTPVIATADGTVVEASDRNDWGNLIIIHHSDGYQTRYAHLKGFAIKAKQTVKKGQVIGYVGSTGLSKGPHLHYEVRRNDKTLNPLNFIK